MRLKGGLGNQMFQYATGRALALRNNMALALDPTSGFVRDRIFRRIFSLAEFPIRTKLSGAIGQLPFWYEQIHTKLWADDNRLARRPWGLYVDERGARFLADLVHTPLRADVWLEGYWQSEKYFADCTTTIGLELTPPAPKSQRFLSLAKEIEASESVAVGVRLFEEVPGKDKMGVGGLVPFGFYEESAKDLHRTSKSLVFYVFCTKMSLIEGKLNLPGKVVYVTHDNGFEGQNDRLWLISRCRHHILSNSSFYWWGAWLSEYEGRSGEIIAADAFANSDTISDRWQRQAI